MASYGALKVLLIAVLIIASAEGKKKKKCKKNCDPPPPCVPETNESPCKYSGQVIQHVSHTETNKDGECFIEYCWCEDGVIKPIKLNKDCCCKRTEKPEGAEEILERLVNNAGQMSCLFNMIGQEGGGMPMPEFGGGMSMPEFGGGNEDMGGMANIMELLGGGDSGGMGGMDGFLEMLGNMGGGIDGMGVNTGGSGGGSGGGGPFSDVGGIFQCMESIKDRLEEDPDYNANEALLQCFSSLDIGGIGGIFGGEGRGEDCLERFLDCLGIEQLDLDTFSELEELPENFMQCLLSVLSSPDCGGYGQLAAMGGGGEGMNDIASIMQMLGNGEMIPGGMGGILGGIGVGGENFGNIESILACLRSVAEKAQADPDFDERRALLGCFGILGNNGIGGLLGSLKDKEDSEGCSASILDCMGVEGFDSFDDASQGLPAEFMSCLIASLENGDCALPDIRAPGLSSLFGGGEAPGIPDCIRCLIELLQDDPDGTDPGFTAAVQACFEDDSTNEEAEESACETLSECLGIENEGDTVTIDMISSCFQSFTESITGGFPE